MAAAGSEHFYSVICSNGARRAAPNEPSCYRNTVAEILELEGVCERVCVFPPQRLQVVSYVSTVTARCMITKLRRVEIFSPSRAHFRLCSYLCAVGAVTSKSNRSSSCSLSFKSGFFTAAVLPTHFSNYRNTEESASVTLRCILFCFYFRTYPVTLQ